MAVAKAKKLLSTATASAKCHAVELFKVVNGQVNLCYLCLKMESATTLL